MHRIVGIFTPGERTVLPDNNPRIVQRLSITQRFNDHLASVELVLALHLLFT
ncbi:hypothetical protein D3C79_1063810 [compost metagenome]